MPPPGDRPQRQGAGTHTDGEAERGGDRPAAEIPVTIRAARHGEMPLIRKLIALFPRELLQAQLPRISSFFVAARGGAIVGCCALEVYSERLAEVRSLAVRPDCAGRGIGGLLVRACLGRARQRGVRQLLAVTSEPSFFENHGFTVHAGWKTAVFADVSSGDQGPGRGQA